MENPGIDPGTSHMLSEIIPHMIINIIIINTHACVTFYRYSQGQKVIPLTLMHFHFCKNIYYGRPSPCVDPESFVRGGPNLITFSFKLMRG